MIKTIYTICIPKKGPQDGQVSPRRAQHRLYFHEYATPDKIIYLVRQVVEWLNDPETRKKWARCAWRQGPLRSGARLSVHHR